jgi:hypothetical protein
MAMEAASKNRSFRKIHQINYLCGKPSLPPPSKRALLTPTWLSTEILVPIQCVISAIQRTMSYKMATFETLRRSIHAGFEPDHTRDDLSNA